MEKIDKKEYIIKAEEYKENKYYFSAIKVYEEGLEKTKNPIFYLYIGICYFELEKYYDALKVLLLYELIGKEDLKTCYYYIYNIYEKIGEINKSNLYCKKYKNM